MHAPVWKPLAVGLLCVLAFAPVHAEEPLPTPQPAAKLKPVEFDETSQKVFEAWEHKAYNLGRVGVKKAKVSIKAKLSNPKLPVPLGCTGTFTWDDASLEENGKLTYADAGTGDTSAGQIAVGAMLMAQGWNAKALSAQYDADTLRKALAGTTLKAQTKGDQTILKVEGRAVDGTTDLVFDKDGVLVELGMSMPSQKGTPLDVRFILLNKKVGDLYLPAGWTYVLDLPGQGKVASTVTITTTKVGAYHVWSKVEEQVLLNEKVIGAAELEFSAYQFNAELGGKE